MDGPESASPPRSISYVPLADRYAPPQLQGQRAMQSCLAGAGADHEEREGFATCLSHQEQLLCSWPARAGVYIAIVNEMANASAALCGTSIAPIALRADIFFLSRSPPQ